MNTATKNCTLIVEDDLDSCDWLGTMLTRRGYPTECARTLREAFEKLEDGPCCVILDLSLPDGSGVDILRHIRARNLPISVAVLTGSTDYSQVGTAISLKPNAYFIKPVDAGALLGWLESACF